MKKVLLLDKDEQNVFLLKRLQDEGCEVALLTPRGGSISNHFPRVANGREALDWAPDYVLCGSSGFGAYLKRFREMGCAVIGGGPVTDKLDSDVITALAYLDAAGVPTPDYQAFTNVAEATDFVLSATKDQPWRLVLSSRDSAPFASGLDLAEDLERRHEEGTLPNQFLVHRDFPGITHNRLDMWSSFQLIGFVHEKGLMNPTFAASVAKTERGIPTTEGVSMTPLPTSNPLVKLTLDRLSQGLGKINYVGPITLGCLVLPGIGDDWWKDKVVVHNLSITPPDGFWAAFLAGLEMPLHYFLERLTHPARNYNPCDFWRGCVSSRKLSLPPYPMTEAPWLDQAKKDELLTMLPSVKVPYKPDIMWNGVQPTEEGATVLQPVLGYLVGKGGTFLVTMQEIRSEFDALSIPCVQAQCDLGETFEVDMLPVTAAEGQLEEENEESVTSLESETEDDMLEDDLEVLVNG